ncbi:hypothetical protein [Nostoc sp. UHCC 0251]|uniref:hypothetical protein n=1 Tax=Nostoc sp. UHCC 0251 TaxID=3110240 RepID=UPI002B1FFBFE|nr:hypothetical protein [Nostoc sp. UHCC 0251]MEA5625841.1 hypothetical protein [Nostoc sp. UHCC 0251]
MKGDRCFLLSWVRCDRNQGDLRQSSQGLLLQVFGISGKCNKYQRRSTQAFIRRDQRCC